MNALKLAWHGAWAAYWEVQSVRVERLSDWIHTRWIYHHRAERALKDDKTEWEIH